MEYNQSIITKRIKALIKENKEAHKKGLILKGEPLYHLYQNSTLAKALGIDTRTLYNYLNGKSKIELKHIIKIADIFNCEVGYIIGEFDSKTKEVSTIQKATGLSDTAIDILKRDENGKPYFDIDISIINKIIEGTNQPTPFNSMIAYLENQKRIEEYKKEQYFDGRIDFKRIVDIVHDSAFYKEVHNYGVYDVHNLADNLAVYYEIIEKELLNEGYTQGQINYLKTMTHGFYMDYFESEVTQKYILGNIATNLITYLENFDFEEV